MTIKKILAWTGLMAIFTPFALAQVRPATVGGGGSIIVGGEFSSFAPHSLKGIDLYQYAPTKLSGIGTFFDINLKPRWGVEGEARWLKWHSSQGESQTHYLIGPRYRVLSHGNFSVWGKFLVGGGLETFPEKIGHGSYFALAPGATVVYQVTQRIDVRADYEYQSWPNAPNLSPLIPNKGISPRGFSIGIGYTILNAQ